MSRFGKSKFLVFLLFGLTVLAASAGDSVKRLSYFADPYGNVGSFWSVNYEGSPYKVLKIKSHDRNGEADFVFPANGLLQFETAIAKLHRSTNNLTKDGFEVIWKLEHGDAELRALMARFEGVKVKLVQVRQTKPGGIATEHEVAVGDCYSAFTQALRDAKRQPK